jgi:enterochelin esterase-like enzyme
MSMARWESFFQFLDEARQSDEQDRQDLVEQLLRERPRWPWVEGKKATFVYSRFGVNNVALNLDIIEADPPFVPMVNLEGTSLWYVQREFQEDDLLDYLLAIDDPMTPLRDEKDLVGRIGRHWYADDLNPRRMSTAQMETSVLAMPKARPFPDWNKMPEVPRGTINEHEFSSRQMGFENRKLWVYTPPGYEANPKREYPLLVLLDGQWMVGPLQVPMIADALIKHNRMEPVIIAMKQSGKQAERVQDYVSNDKHYAAILTELLPLLQNEYRIDATNLGVGGVAVGAIAAAHAALKNPAVFSHLVMLSPPLGKGVAQQKLVEYAERFQNAPLLPKRIFQSVGRYEMGTRFYKPALALAGILEERQAERSDIDFRFAELSSGHGLVAFRAIMPEALAHTFPGATRV